MRFPVESMVGALADRLAAGGLAQAQSGFDRRGGDYLTFPIP